MATNGKSQLDPKVTAYLDFSAQLVRRLDSGNVNAVTMKELEGTLKIKTPRSPAAKAVDFDRLGTQIWNAAIRLKDQSSPILKTWPQLEPQLRVLAYFLLDTAQRSYVKHGSRKSSQNLVRILKTALKAARICINANALELCTMLFEKAAEHVEHKQDPPTEYKKDKQESEADEMLRELAADYYLLRATTSWKQDKPDTVSYWLARVLLLPDRADMLHLAEKKADLTFEVGKSALQQKQFDSAARWLEQSYQIFNDIDPELLSSDFCDLRLVVMLDYGLRHQLAKSRASADSEQEHGFKTELIWKAVTALQQSQNEDEAAKWCNLANHDIFASSGELNKAKLSRKSMVVALSKGDFTAARATYYQMSDHGKSAAMTQYLMYKIALQENDASLAIKSLEGVLKSSSKDTEKYLYACALEAQQMGDRQQFIATMNKVLEFYEKTPLSDVRLPVLLRCIAGSIETELNNNDMPLETGLTELCNVFEAATSALIVLARSEDNIERAVSIRDVLSRKYVLIMEQLQLYLDTRRQIEAFHQTFQEAIRKDSLQPDAISDIELKEFEMIKFDLEALMRLEQWQDLEKVLSMCLDSRHSNRLESAADLVLHIHTHITSCPSYSATSNVLAKIPSVMERIINTCWRNDKDITRLARWIRCLFQMTLTVDPVISLRCLDQASAIATKAATRQIPEAYPPEELEWLATTAFNHAVDLWFAGVETGSDGQGGANEQARAWAEKALMLAGSVGGAGAGVQGLHKVLQDKWMKLKGMGHGQSSG
ncbi:hypothetical protein E4T48_05036 [Aureobasidium sp. EXF-10727]|nr:hypothetical protein E4T48_05036 [Aureobasidium sp. EXF-10727]